MTIDVLHCPDDFGALDRADDTYARRHLSACPDCQAVYHVEHAPPRQEGRCDKCGAALVQRADDKPDTIAARLKVYDQQTSPLVDYYRERGLLRQLDATVPIDSVYRNFRSLVQGTRSR